MRVVHFAVTPLAGAPLRLVRALNAHLPGCTARLVDLTRYGSEDFGQDVVFDETPDLARELAEQADILHFHNYLDLDSRHFAPIDFRALAERGALPKKNVLAVRQFHSEPGLVAGRMGITPAALLAQPIPALVVGQFQERCYPRARVVPNPLPIDDADYLPHDPAVHGPLRHDVFLSPTRLHSAWADRWNTKARPEAEAAVRAACLPRGASWHLVHRTPLAQTLAAKRLARIVVDDLVTGSCHLTGLEGLAQGKPVLAHLDGRCRRVLAHMAGPDTHPTDACPPDSSPFVDVRLEDAAHVLGHLLDHPDEAQEVGRAARTWMEAHWRPERIAAAYGAAYASLARDPVAAARNWRQPDLALDGPAKRFFAVTLPDLVHAARHEAAQKIDDAPHPLSPPPPGLPGSYPVLPDPAIMPPEQCVLAVTERLWLGRADRAAQRVRDHGLPSGALDRWVAECARIRAERLSDPAHRDCNIPRHSWDVVAMVLARGGSRGVPRKALRRVGARALVERAVDVCRAVPEVRRVVINTDCPDIAAAARHAGADVPFLRPAELAGDRVSPFDPWMFAQMWMLLVERRVPDFLLTVSATHPFVDPAEIPRALDRLTAANRPALHTVARLPSASLDFLTLRDGVPAPLPGPAHDARPRRGQGPHGGERFLQCGAFSLESHRPRYRIEPWLRPDMTVPPAPDGNPVAHVIPAAQGLDVDEPWDLAAARLLENSSVNFPPCGPGDIAAHCPATRPESPEPESTASPLHCPRSHGRLACVVLLPPEGPEPPPDGTAPAPETPYLCLEGVPAPCRTVDTVLRALNAPDADRDHRSAMPVFVAGRGVMARAVATRYGLPLLPPPSVPACRAAAREWPVPLFRRADLAEGTAFPGHPVLAGHDVLYVDGRAALLDAATLRAFLASALAPGNESGGKPAAPDEPCLPPRAVCSVSPAPAHPAHLKRVDTAGEVVSVPGIPARRQDLPPVWSRDGALTLVRAARRRATPGDRDTGPETLPYDAVPIGRAQGMLVNSRLDAARGMALAAYLTERPAPSDAHRPVEHAATHPARKERPA
ncbi:cytidylyltransferase domain-containing protein [Nitratidesulfovibrio sp. D1]|uniref:cytidylyltransferase domain-containing protein n=1 Tax=Nitratidesulfovibrio sp. D1 TaxID=3440151 RepID=UPI003EBF361D